MVGNSGPKKGEPRKYFSTLHYANQESRNSLPTAEEQAELAKLKTNYEGTRYQVPADMHNVQDPRKVFKEIEEDYQNHVSNKEDIRWNREHSLENKNSDYDYRFWLQYQVEQISAGNRSMRLMKSRSKEFRDAMSKLSHLTVQVAENLYSMSDKVINTDSKATKIHPLAHLIELNQMLAKASNETVGLRFDMSQDLTLSHMINSNFAYERDFGIGGSTRNNKFLEEKPLFYHLANTTLQVYFKSISRSTKLKRFNKKELIKILAELDYHEVKEKKVKELRQELSNQLLKTKNKAVIDKYYTSTYVCETNSFFRKLYNKIGKVLIKWSEYYEQVPGRKRDDFFRIIKVMHRKANNESLVEEYVGPAREKFRRIRIKTAASCLFSAHEAGYFDFDAALIDELDSLYDSDYEGSNTSYPNVVRMSRTLFKQLNNGDHAIIRHFQMDEKRNMYCLPKPHEPFDISSKGSGGFLHNESMSVSLHSALINLIEEDSLIYTRFEPTQETFNALNTLQKTQWSINLDFLDFIAYFTYEGNNISPYPEDIRQIAWQDSDNMMLREIFIEKMGLRSRDPAMESRFRVIKLILKQARKNLLNAGNVFWHPWFCDWRGRFNTKVNELSPQGDDLSKAMILFADWKPLGERGKFWLYVRAYELLRKIPAINEGMPKIDAFNAQVEWVEKRLAVIMKYGKKLNRNTPEIELEKLLLDLKLEKPKPKSEIFQRIAFLIEFVRIHDVYSREKDWDKVESGLPVHLDASCNGFQHIAALTRNEELAKEVNVLNKGENAKGDLYKEVAETAKDNLNEDFKEAKILRTVIEDLCLGKKSRDDLIERIFSREFCKPLVILAGYGATDLHSTIMNFNGKKLRGGRYQPKKGKKSLPTLHLESSLYQVIDELDKKHPGEFDRLVLKRKNDSNEYLTPIDNCIRAHRFGLDLAKYIHKCISVATQNELGEIKNNLKQIYSNIDTLDINTEADLKDLDDKTSEQLRILLNKNGRPSRKLKKAERLNAVKQLVIDKWKNKLYFSWQANETSSIVRYIKWKLNKERNMAKLPTAILPKNYEDPGPEKVQNFIINSPSITDELKNRLKEAQKEVREYRQKKKQNSNPDPQSAPSRRLTSMVLMCLRSIVLRSKDEEHRELAKNHFYARFIDLPKSRVKEEIKQGNQFSLDTSFNMQFSTDKKGLKESVKKLRELSNDIILGMVPNYIHSFDALHMQKVVLELERKGIEDIWAVHDSFGVHPGDIDTLREIVNRTFVEIHKDPIEVHLKRIVELNKSILKKEFVDSYLQESNNKINEDDSYPVGDWINDVPKSKYLIS